MQCSALCTALQRKTRLYTVKPWQNVSVEVTRISRKNRLSLHHRTAPVAAYKSNPKYNKYRSPLTIEQEHYREWESLMSARDSTNQQQGSTALSKAASLAAIVKFYVLPGPVRFVWFYVWQAFLAVLRQIRQKIILQGAKLEAALLQRAGQPSLIQRRMVLLRWHGRISSVENAKYWMRLLQGKVRDPQLLPPELGDYGPNYMPSDYTPPHPQGHAYSYQIP